MTLHSGCAGSSGLDASNHIDDLMLPYLDVCAALDDWLAEEGVRRSTDLTAGVGPMPKIW